MTAFRLKRKESEKKGIRRVAHGRAEEAVELLRDEGADPVKAVHEARKDLKKLRSTLKLVRPALGRKAYDRENRRFRDAGRALSDARDAQVLADTVDALAERFAEDPPPGGWWDLRAALGVAEAPADGDLESLRERTAAEIERGDEAIGEWPLGENGFDLLRPGLRRAYARGRKSFRRARKQGGDKALHEFRKRSKDLWYQLRLLRRGWPVVLQAAADEAHELSDRLGDDRDLVLLRAHLGEAGEALTAEQRTHLDRLIDRRRAELQKQAFAYGQRLFAERPKRFVRRLERYWNAAAL
jgi:CHAD domain-containing protein